MAEGQGLQNPDSGRDPPGSVQVCLPGALQHLTLEDDDSADRGVDVDLDDAVGPVGVEGLEVFPAPLDEQLLEGGLVRVLQAHDHVFAVIGGCTGIDKDQVTLMEDRLHAGAAHPQDVGIFAAVHRAGESWGVLGEGLVPVHIMPVTGLHPGDQRQEGLACRVRLDLARRCRTVLRAVQGIHPALWLAHGTFQFPGQFIADRAGGAAWTRGLAAHLAQVRAAGLAGAGKAHGRAGLANQALEIAQPDLAESFVHAGSLPVFSCMVKK